MPRPIEPISAFESTDLPHHDGDVAGAGHSARRHEDLELLRERGVTRLREPVRRHRIEAAPGEYDSAELTCR